MANTKPIRIKSISEFHQLRNLPAPGHPLISVVNVADFSYSEETMNMKVIMDFYSISLKRNCGKIRYGQTQYDFDKGVMYFIAPNQVFSVENSPNEPRPTGSMLLIHPDFFWNTALAKAINRYEFFGYAVNEALWLSEKEEFTIIGIMQNIQQEYHNSIDRFSKQIIVSQVESLLNYSERFYNRQFITREKSNHQILDRLEKLLSDYFNSDDLVSKGLPTVQHISDTLNTSPKYLSSLMKVLTGQSTQQHIHDKLIDKAKEKLSTTNLSVSEIAYELGFEHSQSFSKLFKTKTNVSPLEFRQSFN
ncbi:AraC family transcriptional regulator [Terrimonas sp.]|uniref:helix-turn-helix domain-containing protein n=1 Tax=Terrimonas sp. TaxID=1914338 RepID=UPI000D50CC31|nr:AraC family transcriptional regulator [Terrimonas sp.]PVD51009.1 AraC family transcriptional regulator [Terrimonas sp.]